MAVSDKVTLVPGDSYGVVYGRFIQGVGGPSLASGIDENPDAEPSGAKDVRISFRPSARSLVSDTFSENSFAPTTYAAYTDTDGFFEISLMATDSPGASIEGWSWEAVVEPMSPGGRHYNNSNSVVLRGLKVAANTVSWLGEIVAEEYFEGEFVTQGVSAYRHAVSAGYQGSQSEFSGDLKKATDVAIDFDGALQEVTASLWQDLTFLDSGDAANPVFNPYPLMPPTGTSDGWGGKVQLSSSDNEPCVQISTGPKANDKVVLGDILGSVPRRLSALVRSVDGAVPRVGFRWIRSDGTGNSSYVDAQPVEEGWYTISGIIDPPYDDNVGGAVWLWNSGGEGIAEFRNIRVDKVVTEDFISPALLGKIEALEQKVADIEGAS